MRSSNTRLMGHLHGRRVMVLGHGTLIRRKENKYLEAVGPLNEPDSENWWNESCNFHIYRKDLGDKNPFYSFDSSKVAIGQNNLQTAFSSTFGT
jgi:hypothetical protein